MREKKDNYLVCLLFISLIGTNITYSTDNGLFRVNNNVYVSILLLGWIVLLYFMVKKGITDISSRYNWFVGVCFSLLYTATYVTNNAPGNLFISNGMNIAFTVFSFLSWTVVFALSFGVIRNYFGYQISDNQNVPKTVYLWLIIIAIWAVSTFAFLPGQISWDGLRQFCEFEGTHISKLDFTYVPTNHHPWFTTLIFGHLFNFGRSLLGVNFGVFTVVAFQFIVTSVIYSFVVKYVWQKVGKVGGIIALVLFVSPFFSSYAVTVDKSTIYYGLAAWFYLIFAKIFEKIRLQQSLGWSDIILYCLSATFFGLFRNDAFLIVVIATLILLGLTLKNSRKLLLLLSAFVIILGIHFGWNDYLNKKGVIKSSPSEALTIPIRQLSYVYLQDKGQLSSSDLATINKITPLSKIKGNFDVNSGDGLKTLFPSDTFLNLDYLFKDVKSHKITIKTTETQKQYLKEYLYTWLKVGMRNPIKYVYVYIAANSRYFNPFISYDNGLFGLNYFHNMPDFLHTSWYRSYHPMFSNNIREWCKNILLLLVMCPLLAILGNPAILMWTIFCLIFVILIKKDRKNILFVLPIFIMILLCTVTSINGYTRYSFGVLAALPIVVSYIWRDYYNIRKYRGEK